MAAKKKESKIRSTAKKMRELLGEIDQNSREIVESLIEEAAFMRETLRDLRKTINENGCVVEYKNGENQYGTKKSPEVDVYNTMIKNYNGTIKQIIDVVGRTSAGGEVNDGFEEFAALR